MVDKVKAAHILVKSEDAAKAILARLNAGESFSKLASDLSQCPSGKNGGDLGWFGRGMMVRPFEIAAFELEKGQLSGIVKTQFGYHIIKRLE